MIKNIKPLILTVGESAGIGPNITIKLAQYNKYFFVAICDKNMLSDRAKLINKEIKITEIDLNNIPQKKALEKEIYVLHTPLKEKAIPGKLNPKNSSYVIKSLDIAVENILNGKFSALITAPIHKGVINEAGFQNFTGHTEFLQKKAKAKEVVMMLASKKMKVALLTTHMPLKEVYKNVTENKIIQIISLLNEELQLKYKIKNPRIGVCGLNPHAGENGYLGDEEIKIINPTIKKLQSQNINVSFAQPADTLFTINNIKKYDVILSMYHDQGLPVIKSHSFGNIANITLGLPFVRTSVDHGTALDLANSDLASVDSLNYAMKISENLTK